MRKQKYEKSGTFLTGVALYGNTTSCVKTLLFTKKDFSVTFIYLVAISRRPGYAEESSLQLRCNRAKSFHLGFYHGLTAVTECNEPGSPVLLKLIRVQGGTNWDCILTPRQRKRS